MATITTNTFLDGGVARTAGETWAINGGILTVRTDTRVHANAPASMTGTIGATTISSTLGGGVLLDGRNVRWMPYNSGTGNVPAIGTLVTQGGVEGYLLGVWPDAASAPTAVGASMPTTGFLKFREVTGGPFSAGALTGIGASAVSADVVGWIEVVQLQAVANTVPRLGFFRTRGDWFELGTTSGSSGQIFQVPSNGGGSNTLVPAVWIETAPGSDEYEIYPCIITTYFNTTNIGTDERSKFLHNMGSGQVRIGSDGTNTIGFVPAAGCKVRIPNVIGRQATAAGGHAVNQPRSATDTTNPDFATTSAGEIDFEYFLSDWLFAYISAYSVRQIHCATFNTINVSNLASPFEIEDCAVSPFSAGVSFNSTTCLLGGTITSSKFFRADAASNGHPFRLTDTSNVDVSDCHMGIVTYARTTGDISLTRCRNITFDGCYQYACQIQPATCVNLSVTDHDHIDRIVGVTNATVGKNIINASANCDNVIVDGVTFGLNGLIPDVNPYLALFQCTACSNMTFRNAGTFAAPLDAVSPNGPQYVLSDTGVNDGIRVQNIHLESVRTGLYASVNTSKNILIETARASSATGSQLTASLDTIAKNLKCASNSVTGVTAVYGTHFFDMFESDTQGRIWLAFNEPTAFSADQYEAVSLGTGAGFTSAGQISMPNLGDEIIFTMPYYVQGHTAFDNSAPTLTGTNTGNFTYQYKIDKNDGNGFSASWATLNAANLSAEVVDPADGFKLKIRIVVATANASNALTYIRITTDSTALAQGAISYPQDYTTVTLNGLVAGSRVQLYDLTNDVELYNQVVAGTSLSYQTPYVDDFNMRVRVMKMSGVTAYKLLEFEEPVTINGVSRSVTQEVDTVYALNGIDGSTITTVVIDDNNLLVEVDTGTITWAAIYAYETYWLFTEEGIRDETRFIEAVDPANYKIFDFAIKNVSSPSAPLIITGGYGVDGVSGAALDIIDTSGGTIFCSPEHVVAYETSGGGGGASAADIWSYGSRSLTSGAAPSAASVASAVRTELATELGRVDVSISTRLAAGDYTAPDNSGISSIKNKTDNLPNDPADASDIATSFGTVNSTLTTVLNYIDTEVAAIKAKTDNLPSDPADASVVAGLIASVEAKVDAVDTVVDAIKVKTDALPSDPADQSLILAAISGIPSAPSAATVASAVRTELSTELGRIDAAITTRMATFTYTAPDNASIAAILIDTNELQLNQGNWATATGFAVPGSAMTLTSGERSAVATAVEAALLNEGDSQQLIDAIVTAIGNTNMDEVALVSAIRLDLERAGGLLNNLPTLTEIEASTILAKKSDINALNNLSAAQVWASGTRTLTSGSNIILAKGVGVTGFNDISTAEVRAEVEAEVEDIRTNTNIIPALV